MIILLILFLLILLAGFFSSTAAAFSSLNKDDLKETELKQSPHKIKQFDIILSDIDKLHAITEIGLTSSLIGAVFCSVIYVDAFTSGILLDNYKYYTMSMVLLIPALLYWIFGLLVAKAIGIRYANEIAVRFVALYVFLYKLMHYPIKVILAIADFLVIPTGVKTSFSHYNKSEDGIRVLISEGLKHGAINKTEHEILQNVFEFTDLRANEVMIPRTEMSGVELTDNDDEMFQEILKFGHSLVPVYQDSLDNITGIIHIKDIFKSLGEKREMNIKSLIRPAYFVPETKLISEILKEMQTRGVRITIVTDEYGGTEGVLTLEDIIGEIVGEITREGEVKVLDYMLMQDGSFTVFGSMDIEDFNETFSVQLPESEEYSTVAGFVSFQTGKILNVGEVYEYEGIEIELIKKVRQKMVQFKFGGKDSKFYVNEKH